MNKKKQAQLPHLLLDAVKEKRVGLSRNCAVGRSEQNISLDNIYKISVAFKITAAKLLEAST